MHFQDGFEADFFSFWHPNFQIVREASVTLDSTTTLPGMRQILRNATGSVHERLHAHAGFAAIQNGSITRDAYLALLLRLYGFHVAFEHAAQLPADRSRWLAQDIEHLSAGVIDLASVPACKLELRLGSPACLLGGMYVIEGSSLGGLGMFKGLDHVCGAGVIDGRRFLHGRGSNTAGAFRLLLARVEAAGNVPASRAIIIEAALATFEAFETWMKDWKIAALAGTLSN